MNRSILGLVIIILIVVPILFFALPTEDRSLVNTKPTINITYPNMGDSVSKLVTITGTASDIDGNKTLEKVELFIQNEWIIVNGTTTWSYTWDVYYVEDDVYTIKARSFDGRAYSDEEELKIYVSNPEIIEGDSHKWAIFITAANFCKDNETKLGNGGLLLAERISAYFIENLGYSTSNIIILFDDGLIRSNNGLGEPIETLQQRDHQYDVTYGSATKNIVEKSINYIIQESNKFDDSEVFIWIASHGQGDIDNPLTGGKIFDRSSIFLWDGEMSDDELGSLLSTLKSDKTCIIVDACFSGGFADKLIFNLPEFILFKSDVPKNGRVVITAASKFRVAWSSNQAGPLFTQLWFDGIVSGEADGFKPGLFNSGRPTKLKLYKDGKVSVEEAFYFARYILKTNENLKDYNKMEPQINDQYPKKGAIRSLKGLILGE